MFSILLLGFFEVLGIASVLPFMELLSKPNAVDQSKWLTYAYELLNFQSLRSFVIAVGCFIIGVITLANIVGIATNYFQLRLSWNIAHRFSTSLLRVYLKKPYSFFLSTNTSDLRAYTLTEVSALVSGILIPLIDFISRSIICLVIFTLLMLVSPQVTLTMAFFLGGMYGLIYVSRSKFLKRLGKQRIKSNALRFRFLEEMLTGIKTVKIYKGQQYFYQRYEEESRSFNNIQPKVQMTYATPKYLLEVLAFGAILGVTLYLFITEGDLTKALPRLSLYAIAGYRLLPALQKAFAAIAKVKHNWVSLHKLYDDLMIAKADPGFDTTPKTPVNFERSISVKNICFTYENQEEAVLHSLNLDIPKGSMVAMVGSTGSGKTTMIDIITGLLTPSSGTISIDNTVLDPEKMEAWQEQIAYVPQEVFLYDDTVRANIIFGADTGTDTDERLEYALKMAGIHDFVTGELSDGVDSAIGERGVRLSGGQRQRLGLARALYKNPSVLVLDEATSALDSITEKAILESLQALPDDLTIIMIAHRLSTVQYADKIFLLNQGKLVSEGSYQELIENNDTFKEMDAISWRRLSDNESFINA